MQRLNNLAEVSVARGCGFATLGIVTLMLGFAGNLRLSLAVGGCLALLTAFVLLLKAANSRRVSYKRTELWIMLEPEERPGPEIAQQVIGGVLHSTYLRFALMAVRLAIALLTLSLLVRVLKG